MTHDKQPPFVYDAHSETDTDAFGKALAAVLPSACVIALNGTLGAGKTRLVQALAAGVGIDRRDVVSPTFVLVQEYHGSRSIIHVDAYRLKDETSSERWEAKSTWPAITLC